MTEKSLTVHESDSRIAPWGSRDDLREIARRVQMMAPGGKKLQENEALALAQGAVSHGLDPFNGEIWYIPGSGLMAGIKGLRKAARHQIAGNFWPEFVELRNPDERNALMIPDGALAFRCIIRDSETIRAYSDAWAQMRDKGVPTEIIPTVIGQRPYVEGVGYVKRDERTKMDPVQVAMKRAEADALKRRFDLPFATPTEPTDTVVVDGDWAEMAPPPDAPPQTMSAADASEALFGTHPTSVTVDDAGEIVQTPAVEKRATATDYWTAVKKSGLDRDAGVAILEECGKDFGRALDALKKQTEE
jgi:hypothetical protein